ncbi:hypothetical protein H5J25_08220 [Sphingomonas aliaeris]|uniref:Lipoprotein n=1 Tax=Sphingomonas aliaeris TaxID=2759526 RepID=A0A974NXA6_9SPHN|nr:hypothetical protein [Sphingomonas aliaeris]QQV78586.1 hypothetical protein H5J25_08220 [Sphingomonas aliaeris]
MRRASMICAVATMLGACATRDARTTPAYLSPVQAVFNAAARPQGVTGVFEMVVRASGRQDRMLYLNSELDYRDHRNLTIAMSPAIERELQNRIGGPIEPKLRNVVIAVRGTARKTRIDFTRDGRPTGKYYFQTHVWLRSARDLTVSGERPAR